MHEFAPISMGRTLDTKSAIGFIATDTEHEAGAHLDWHAHKRAAISIVLDGVLQHTDRRQAITCKPGDILFEPPEREHRSLFPTTARTFILEFDEARLQDVQTYSQIFHTYARVVDSRLARILMNAWGESRRRDVHAAAAIEVHFWEIISAISCIRGSLTFNVAWLKTAEDFVRAHFRDGFSLTALAQCVGRHPAHVSRAFRRSYGMTISEFARSLQVDSALGLLRAGRYSIAEVAALSGFYDQSHLGTVLQRRLRTSPMAYRRRASCALTSSYI